MKLGMDYFESKPDYISDHNTQPKGHKHEIEIYSQTCGIPNLFFHFTDFIVICCIIVDSYVVWNSQPNIDVSSLDTIIEIRILGTYIIPVYMVFFSLIMLWFMIYVPGKIGFAMRFWFTFYGRSMVDLFLGAIMLQYSDNVYKIDTIDVYKVCGYSTIGIAILYFIMYFLSSFCKIPCTVPNPLCQLKNGIPKYPPNDTPEPEPTTEIITQESIMEQPQMEPIIVGQEQQKININVNVNYDENGQQPQAQHQQMNQMPSQQQYYDNNMNNNQYNNQYNVNINTQQNNDIQYNQGYNVGNNEYNEGGQ